MYRIARTNARKALSNGSLAQVIELPDPDGDRSDTRVNAPGERHPIQAVKCRSSSHRSPLRASLSDRSRIPYSFSSYIKKIYRQADCVTQTWRNRILLVINLQLLANLIFKSRCYSVMVSPVLTNFFYDDRCF